MRSLVVAVCLASGVGVAGVFAVACSNGDTVAPAADGGDAGAADVFVAADAEASLEQDPNVYPAQHQPIPVMTNPGKGPVLATPKVVTITFTGDAKRDAYRAFDDTILTTDWWKAAIGGIGVGTGASGGHVELSPPWMPATHPLITDDQVRTVMQQGITDGTIPAPEPGTIYAFYFPKYVTITNGGGASCAAFCGYHDNATVLVPQNDGGAPEAGMTDGGDGGDAAPLPPTGNPVDVAYAIMATCDPPGCWSTDPFEQMTIIGSHELAEASSDPHPSGDPAYSLGTDDSWLNPDFYPPGSAIENGDACVGLVTTQGNYEVQRIWSNAAAMRGDQPCQPVAAGSIYFGGAPRSPKQNVNGHASYGYLFVRRGSTATAIVDVFSNAALQNDMLLYAGKPKRSQSDPSDLAMLNNDITLSLSRQSAHNGNAVMLQVSVPDTSTTGDFRMVVRAVYNGDYNDWPLIIHVR